MGAGWALFELKQLTRKFFKDIEIHWSEVGAVDKLLAN